MKLNYSYALPVNKSWLLHSPLHHITALVNSSVIDKLKNASLSGKTGELIKTLSEEPVCIPGPPKGPLKPEFMGIIPTRACNFNCLYCDFGASSAKEESMDFKLASSLIDWMGEYIFATGGKKIEIHFFGGESFYSPAVLKVAVHRARMVAARYNLTARFEVTTNGFFSEELCGFAGDYFDKVVLSMDGPKEIQNKYRPLKNGKGSYDIVAGNARLLSKSPVDLCIRLCITDETVNDMAGIAEWICREFRPSSINFEILQKSSESMNSAIMPPDPWEFALNYIKSSEIAWSFGVMPVYSASQVENIQHTFCPVGKDNIIVSPAGEVNACYLQKEDWIKRGMDLNMGFFSDGEGMKFDNKSIESVRKITAGYFRCRNCFARWHCGGGCHVNHSYPGSSSGYDDFCIQTRIITAARLLEELGCHEEKERFLSDRKGLERLVFQKSDSI